MLKLTRSLAAWGTKSFAAALKAELEGLDVADLPLQQGLERTSYVTESPFRVSLLGLGERGSTIEARIGVFYAGVVAGCACADDPGPVEEQPEYCELLIEIHKDTADIRIALL
jgi:hypothetical protein